MFILYFFRYLGVLKLLFRSSLIYWSTHIFNLICFFASVNVFNLVIFNHVPDDLNVVMLYVTCGIM
jgi:hypothetical protein